MIYWLMQATGSATLMGLLMMMSILPGIVLGPIGGLWQIVTRESTLSCLRTRFVGS